MIICNQKPTKPLEKSNNIKKELYQHWNNSHYLKKYIGVAGKHSIVDDAIAQLSAKYTKYPFIDGYNAHDRGSIDRLKVEFDHANKTYEKGGLSFISRFGKVTDANARKNPLLLKFEQDLIESENFQRNKTEIYNARINTVVTEMNKLLFDNGDSRYRKRINELTQEIKEADSEHVRAELIQEIEAENRKNGGQSNTLVKNLLEMDKKKYKKFVEDKRLQNTPEFRVAVELRSILDNVGKDVLIPALDKIYQTALEFNGGYKSQGVNKLGKDIKSAKERILTGIRKGGYMPHIKIESLYQINDAYQRKLLSGAIKNKEDAMANLGQVILTLPDHAKARNPENVEFWEQDPVAVVDKYAQEAIAFNKITAVNKNYTSIVKHFPKDKFSPEFILNAREWLDDTYQVANRGFKDRPDYINTLSRWILSLGTLKSMVGSLTGPIRNVAGAMYMFTSIGPREASRALSDIKKNRVYNDITDFKIEKINGYDEKVGVGIQEIVNQELKEQGFEFTGEAYGRELVQEGIIPETADFKTLDYDPVDGSIKYIDRGVEQKAYNILTKLVQKGLGLHRLGENILRSYFHKSAYTIAFKRFSKLGIPLAEKKKLASAEARMLQASALGLFEYATFAKARGIAGSAPRGEYDSRTDTFKMRKRDYLSSISPLFGQFLHYPMSFVNTTFQMGRGVKRSIEAGIKYDRMQLDSPEMYASLAWTGIALGSYGISMLFDANIVNLVENPVIKGLQFGYQKMTGFDDEEYLQKSRGLVSEATGPLTEDIIYTLMAYGLMDTPETQIEQFLLGGLDRTTQDDNMKAYRISTAWGFANKVFDDTSNGNTFNALLRHSFAAYPTDWTREGNKNIWNFLNKITGKKAKKKIDKRTLNSKERASLKLYEFAQQLNSKYN